MLLFVALSMQARGDLQLHGFINYNSEQIPFVMEDYRLILFSENPAINEFCKEYNFKNDYLLSGTYFRIGSTAEKITFLVSRSIGTTCYIKCYIAERFNREHSFENICFYSKALDSIFKYKYKYIDLAREGVNLSAAQYDVYNITFVANKKDYTATYSIGQSTKMGLWEPFQMCVKLSVNLHTADIHECYTLALLFERFAKFMTGQEEVPFNKIDLLNNGIPDAWFYYNNVNESASVDFDVIFHEFDVEKYTPKILNNLGLDLDSKVENSVPLGHIHNYDNLCSPQRFIEQIMAFEYLYEKIYPSKGKKNQPYLKEKLIKMFNFFPSVLRDGRDDATAVAENIKEVRRNITHGYAYYYDFNNDSKIMYYIFRLDSLIKHMSLLHMGFSEQEIKDFKPEIW